MKEQKQSWIQSVLVYKDIRMLKILLLGAISGFPWVLIATSLSLWLKRRRFKQINYWLGRFNFWCLCI